MQTPYFSIIKRYFTTIKPPTVKLCIVGAGPAGFYAAQRLAKLFEAVEVDIYERLPVPFGLVRFGVAPDHPEVKNVIHTFSKTAENPKVRFIGNVNLGSNISLRKLREAYHAVLLAYGAEENRSLNIPGEDLSNILPARRIVGWYNGISEDANLNIDLTGRTVCIIGQGNVAIDVARILLTPIDIIKKTDITQHAVEALSASNVKEVYLIGRRGPLQAAFTIKELREMLKLNECQTCWVPNDFDGVPNVISELARPRKRLTELMLKSLNENINVKDAKLFKPIFYRSPLQLTNAGGHLKVCLGVNQLQQDKAVLTDSREYIDCNLGVTSIGYKSIQVDPDIPFDHNRGTALNNNGKIEDGLYATGWLATGPTGVIVTTMNNAFSTADLIGYDLNQIKDRQNKPGFEAISAELKLQNLQIVTWKDWLKIDAYEENEGKKFGKPREKLIDVKKILEIAH